MTIDKINPDDKELRFRDLINTINDTIDELNSASNVHYVKKAGDVIQGTLTANGTQGVMFAATGGGFSRPITFEDNNIPFNNTSGTTVAFLSTQGSFNLTGRINFVETSASPYSWRFLPDYGNNELKLQGANNTTIMTITDSQVKFESDVEIEDDLILGGKATVGAQASGAWDVMPKHQVEQAIADAIDTVSDSANGLFSNSISITGTQPTIWLKKTVNTNQNRIVAATSNGAARWALVLSDQTVESGGNSGSNFKISRYNDAGVYIDDIMNISRSTGVVTFSTSIRNNAGIYNCNAPSNGNAGYYLRDANTNPRGLLYWNRVDGAVRLQVYAGANNTPITQLSLHADGKVKVNGNDVYDASSKASVADYRANVNNKILTTDTVWDAAAVRSIGGGSAGETLSAGAHTPDFGTGINFYNVISGNVTINNPTNAKSGQTGVIALQQDATGGRTISFGSNWKFANGQLPTINTGANRINAISYFVLTPTYIIASVIPGTL